MESREKDNGEISEKQNGKRREKEKEEGRDQGSKREEYGKGEDREIREKDNVPSPNGSHRM